MRKILVILFLSFSTILFAQKTKLNKLDIAKSRVFLRAGNKQYINKNYSEAQALYKKALEKNDGYSKASFNLGNAMFKQKNYKDALPQFELDAKLSKTKSNKAEAYHNIGNTQMKQKQYSKAVQAYKESLRNKPTDEKTRYNLALAQELLKKKLQNKSKNNNLKKARCLLKK